MIEQIAIGALSAATGGAAAWAALQARVRRLEEIVADLKEEKASKESLGAVASSMTALRDEIDRRFDRLEDLLKVLAAGKVTR
jgi:HAMP domain-containing protein